MSTTAQDCSSNTMEQQQHDGHKRSLKSTTVVIPLTPVSPPPAQPPSPIPPPSARDKGYAWVVVAAVFGVNTLCAGYIKSFGIMYMLLMEYFPDASGASVGWIMGLLVGTRGLLAPFMGAMSVKVGPRRCVLAGTLLVALGLTLAVPAFSIFYMAVTLGGLVGIGIAMSETPGYLLVTDYFLEKRTTANSIRSAGNPMGGILFSPLLVFLKEYFGLQGTFIIMAGVMLHLAILGTLMRPYELQEEILRRQHIKKTTLSLETASVKGKTHSARKLPPKKALDFTLFKNPHYLMYLAVAMSVNIALPNFLLYIPAYGKSVGLTNYQIPVITSYQSGIDCVIRFLLGYVIQKLRMNEEHVFAAGLVVGGAGCLLVTLCCNMWQLLLATTLFSIGLAAFWSIINTLLANHFGAESMASSWGFFRMTQGITSFVYPSMHGLLKDLTGSLVTPFLMMGGGLILGAFIFSLKPLIDKISKARNR